MDLLIKAFDLSNKITNREYLSDNWKSILDGVAELFGVDGAFIGLWEDDVIRFKHSSFFMRDNFPKEKFPELYEVPLKKRRHFHEKLKKDGFIKIYNYQKYKYSLKPWIKVGLKSLLAVAIQTKSTIYGSLHLISLTKHKKFSSEKVEVLKKIADSIASELEKQRYIEEIEKEKEKNKRQLEFLSLLDHQLKYKLSANFIAEALKKIKVMVNANTASLLFASEDLYIQVNDSTVFGTINDSKNSPIYNLWKNNATEISEACIPHSKSPFAVFIPIVSFDRAVAIFCFSFDKEPSNEFKRELSNLQIALTHFISIVHTYKNIKIVSSKLSETEEGLIEAFVSATEAKDVYTKGHSEHVAVYSKIIAKKLGLDIHQQEMIYNAGLLHDIGKIGIPDMILLKPTDLTPFEYEIIKYHPIISYEIIKNVPKFRSIATCIRHHHEKMDGSGYPDGLKGDQIELGARILAIADIFDALTTDRPYRKGLSPEEAIKILKEEKIDQNILKKVENELIEGFLKETRINKTYLPEDIEKLRRDIIDFDFMTGLKRRSFLIHKIDKLIKDKKPFTLFMVDIKNTSYLNYKYGREVGDKIIMFVAEELKKIAKKEALSRVGADSFMFIYLSENAEAFQSLMEWELKQGIIKKIESKSCIISKDEAKKIIGCHITFARFPQEGKSAEELMYICSLKKKKNAYKKYAELFGQEAI
ncbi:HD domain-containing phosphohydrolase [Hippea alviniae]|uniref:HD domain-containing phosphohydrolase n=1 Tax=Hippea alviniae TaxID=1279027 RepID=UPI0003B573D3|nr:HD domain-containing phosphohydrolase [Hippea alviniae]